MYNEFQIIIVSASNEMFTVCINGQLSKDKQIVDLEFTGTMPEVGDFIKVACTQQ